MTSMYRGRKETNFPSLLEEDWRNYLYSYVLK